MLKRANALRTLIHQRHPTPSCGGHVPTAERTLDPARIFTESLTPGPELENSLGRDAASGLRPGLVRRRPPEPAITDPAEGTGPSRPRSDLEWFTRVKVANRRELFLKVLSGIRYVMAHLGQPMAGNE